MSSPKFLSIPTTLTLTLNLPSSLNPPKTPPFFPNLTSTLRLHLTQNPKNPSFHTPSKTHLNLHHPLLATLPNTPAPSPDHQSKQAQEAIVEILKELGVSEEEVVFVSMNSSRYLRMLIDGVEELEEIGVWREEVVGFKENVKSLAKEKGDNGKVVEFVFCYEYCYAFVTGDIVWAH